MKLCKSTLRSLPAAAALLAASASAFAAGGLDVAHLGANNTLVRITGDAPCLLLPVQDNVEDARINVLVDGKIAETIHVRLAKTATDFTVPYDLTPYAGKNVVLEIVENHGHQSADESRADVCWNDMKLADGFTYVDQETKYRPLFHHAPQYGWMNDPNGMFYKDGKWHLYYQYNPYGSKWQNMSWGHSVSDDLIRWEHLPVAFRPDGLGSIFSGSCVVDHNNTAGFGNGAVVALYTSAGTSQMQSMAASTDGGLTFSTFGGNPIITLDSEARDPNLFWNEATGEWNLYLAHALEHEMLFFTSPDLKTWTLQSSFGKGIACQDGVWECPDLFELPVDGSKGKKWVLLCNINPGAPFGGSATQYFIGDWDGHTFTADTDASGVIPTKWLDFGKDHYATVSWSDAPDGRRTIIGWMSNWQYANDVPTLQYRSANTLPREAFIFRAPDNQLYAGSRPSPELDKLRAALTEKAGSQKLSATPATFTLPADNDGICEINVAFQAKKGSDVKLTLFNNAGEEVIITYNAADHTVAMDRTKSGLTDFSADFPAVTVGPTFEKDGKISLRLFIDRSSIELFSNGGRTAMTNLVFPTQPYTGLRIASDGNSARLNDLKIYSLSAE
ncbi:MAG: GH32 C-terminal domain-containing protein [Muribaculaceae bacterium]|nr:GH32 C-terminal domain-containing protein [Muribaculaceae bacterium]